jgi:hypothetical protein
LCRADFGLVYLTRLGADQKLCGNVFIETIDDQVTGQLQTFVFAGRNAREPPELATEMRMIGKQVARFAN